MIRIIGYKYYLKEMINLGLSMKTINCWLGIMETNSHNYIYVSFSIYNDGEIVWGYNFYDADSKRWYNDRDYKYLGDFKSKRELRKEKLMKFVMRVYKNGDIVYTHRKHRWCENNSSSDINIWHDVSEGEAFVITDYDIRCVHLRNVKENYRLYVNNMDRFHEYFDVRFNRKHKLEKLNLYEGG